jgi:hypothetical protein
MKTFAKQPETYQAFEGVGFDASILNELQELKIDDPTAWDEYSISSKLHRRSIQNFIISLREKSFIDEHLKVLKISFDESKRLIRDLANVGSTAVTSMKNERSAIDQA